MNETHPPALFKILGHPERYEILKRLMAAPATLSQLGEAFKKTPAHIRHHVKVLEQAGLVEFVEARPVQGGPEKYYRAAQRALLIHETVLPELSEGKVAITVGSMDTGITRLAEYISFQKLPVHLLPVPISSLDGLIALRQSLIQMSTCHLINPQSEEYNRPFVRHLFPSQAMALIQIYRREGGLMLKPGNPLGIRALEDLARPEVRFVNREPGSGIRQWLDLHLGKLGIHPEHIQGYGRILRSHGEIARAIRAGEADAGIGIASIAREFGLDFVSLFDEPYELVTPLDLVNDQRYEPFFEALSSGQFRSAVSKLDGYAVPQTWGGIEVVRQS